MSYHVRGAARVTTWHMGERGLQSARVSRIVWMASIQFQMCCCCFWYRYCFWVHIRRWERRVFEVKIFNIDLLLCFGQLKHLTFAVRNIKLLFDLLHVSVKTVWIFTNCLEYDCCCCAVIAYSQQFPENFKVQILHWLKFILFL